MIIETQRLRLRNVDLNDAAFILALVNDPDWLRHIGDRGVRSIDDARTFIEDGPVTSYRTHGFGLWLTELSDEPVAVGLCGILKREYLENPDLGYALLPKYRHQGYAREASAGVMVHAHDALGFDTLDAMVSPRNHRSVHLLEQLGFEEIGIIEIPPDNNQARLFRHQRKRPSK